MNRIKVLVITAIVIILLLIIVFYFVLPNKGADVRSEVIELSSSDGESKIFIKKKVWGMTSDNQIVVISNSSREESIPGITRNYIYEGLMPLLYKFQNDTLFVYTVLKSSVPKEFKTSIKIVQIQLDNPEMLQLIEHDNYKNKGLIVISE